MTDKAGVTQGYFDGKSRCFQHSYLSCHDRACVEIDNLRAANAQLQRYALTERLAEALRELGFIYRPELIEYDAARKAK